MVGKTDAKTMLFDEILTRNIPFGIAPYTLQEVLQGARNEKDYQQLRDYLATQIIYFLPEKKATYEKAARLYFDLRRKGIMPRSTIDILIAIIAMENELMLLHNDRDFEQEDRPVGETGEVQRTLHDITQTPFWQRTQTAEEILTEIPFGIWENDTYLTGIIDLVFKEPDGWIIIDYKTDPIRDNEHRQQLQEYYQPQVEAYKVYWERITGGRVKEALIWFMDSAALCNNP